MGWWLFSHLAKSRQARENGYSRHLAQTPVKKTPGRKRPALSPSYDSPKARGGIRGACISNLCHVVGNLIIGSLIPLTFLNSPDH